MRVLLVEDEPQIATYVARGLRAEAIDVVHRAEGESALVTFGREEFDAVVVDLLLPGMDGLEVVRQVRSVAPSTPVIILSARRDLASKLAGLRAGASDYMVKPFEIAELAERVRLHVRLVSGQRMDDALERAAGMRLDPIERTVVTGATTVRLTEQESRLLRHLMRNAGQVVPRERLLADVWGFSHAADTNVVDVYVRRLRAKIGSDAIRTVRGVGYCLEG